MTNSFDKLKLLMWKNFVLQKRHKLRTLMEILSPVVFVSLLVLVRSLVEPKMSPVVEFPEFKASKYIIDGRSIAINSNCSHIDKLRISYSPKIADRDDPIKNLLEKSLHFMIIDNLNMQNGSIEDLVITNETLCILNAMKTTYPEEFKKCQENYPVPSQKFIECILNILYEINGYENAIALERRLIDPAINDTSLCGVQFDDSIKDFFTSSGALWPNDTTLTLRFPAQLRRADFINPFLNWKTNFMYPIFQVPGPRSRNEPYGGWPSYVREGFIPMAHSIMRQIIKLKSDKPQPNINMRRFPHPEFLNDDLIPVLQSFIPLIIVLTFNYTCINIVKSITVEKEKQLKEVMKIMGLSNWLHWTAWFLKSFIYLLISVVLIVILLKVEWYSTDEGLSGYSVMTFTPWHLLLFFTIIYIITMICFCFMISAFFSNANLAATTAGIIWFTSYFPYSFLSTDKILPAVSTRIFSCLSVNTAMSFGFQIILMNEATSEGMQWSKLFTPLTVDDSFVMGHVIIMLILDAFIYLLITLYIEEVLPGSYGVPRPWYFPFTREYWRSTCKSKSDVEDIPHSNETVLNDNIEADPVGLNIGINIINLSKSYDKKVAVDKLNLKMFENQITVLLGHNGAGKTTTMSMLTGMFPPTSGTAFVAGYDIRNNIDSVRDSLGLCPQHNVLFGDLTVAEHLYFYTRLKGVSGSRLNEEIKRYVQLLGLESKSDAVSSSLSGGMQRRLSVGTALCGGSKVVLLDEPTSGMDPSARRELWELLRLEKKGRTVILTTHFMDEADILGERIAILHSGKLACVGSPFYLKKKFGKGYRLTVARQPASPGRFLATSAPVTNLLVNHIPTIQLETDIGSEISYILPEENVKQFEPMLSDLENNQHNLNLLGFGITAATLEQVFMSVGADINESEVNGFMDEKLAGSTENFEASGSIIKYTGLALLKNQCKAMFMKKYLVAIRSWVLHLLQLIIPIFFLSMAIIIARMWENPYQLPALTLDLSKIYQDSITLLNSDSNLVNDKILNLYKEYFEKTDIQKMELEHNKNNNNMTEYYLGQAKTNIASMRVRNLAGATIGEENITAWFSNFPYHDAPVSLMLVENAVLKSLSPESSFTLVNKPLPFSIQSRFELLMYGDGGGFQIAFNIGFGMAFVSSFYLLFYIKENITRSKLLQSISGISPFTMWNIAFIWDILWFLIISIGICITLVAFQQNGLSTGGEIGRLFFTLMVFGWGMLPFQYLIADYFTSPPAGFAKMCFFNFFTGLASFLIIEVLYAPNLELEHVGDILHNIFMIFPHYSISGAVKNLNQASVTLKTCLAFCDILPQNRSNPTCDQHTICNMNPSLKYCCISDSPYFEWNKPGIGQHLTYMFIVGIISYILLIAKEYRIHKLIFNRFKSNKNPPTIDEVNEDSDVLYERQRIENLSSEDFINYNLLCRNMSKYYQNFLAVNQLSIGIKDECFGLLGINGAGKTTTFKMLTGDLSISSGNAWVKGFSINSQLNKVYQNIGYCPQFDALLGEMTGRETLTMYSLIRGIPDWHKDQLISNFSKKLGFAKHLDKKITECSGGNKRKISTCLALLGDPQVVYLDEPTTGMDPVAKRLTWDAISECHCVILTSHSMEECEALCSRIAIMVNGRPQCLGSPQHLKNKFSQGYTLIVKLKKKVHNVNGTTHLFPDIVMNPLVDTYSISCEQQSLIVRNNLSEFDNLHRFLINKFPDAKIVENFQELITYHLPDANIRWSTIFGIMEAAKEELNIEDYSIGQTSLEQVFLQFTKHQI